MRWTCPHCNRIMSTPDEELVQGWRLVRCSDCKGFSMARKPATASKGVTEAGRPRVLSARREESPAAEPGSDAPSSASSTAQAAVASASWAANDGAKVPARPPVPPVFIYGDRAPGPKLPEPLPELEYVRPSRTGRFAGPVALMALGALAIFAGVQVRETHLNRLAAMSAVRTSGERTIQPAEAAAQAAVVDSISVSRASADRTEPKAAGEAPQRESVGSAAGEGRHE